MAVEKNRDWNKDQRRHRIEERDWKKQALGDHRRQSHQTINHDRDENGEKTHHSANAGEEVKAKKENQRIVHKGNDGIGQKQSEAQAQQHGEQLPQGRGLRLWLHQRWLSWTTKHRRRRAATLGNVIGRWNFCVWLHCHSPFISATARR